MPPRSGSPRREFRGASSARRAHPRRAEGASPAPVQPETHRRPFAPPRPQPPARPAETPRRGSSRSGCRRRPALATRQLPCLSVSSRPYAAAAPGWSPGSPACRRHVSTNARRPPGRTACPRSARARRAPRPGASRRGRGACASSRRTRRRPRRFARRAGSPRRQVVGVAAAVEALVGRADDLRHAAEGRRGAQDPLADHGVAADERPLVGVERRRACRGSRPGSRPCRCRGARRRGATSSISSRSSSSVRRDRGRELGDLGGVVAELGEALGQRAQERVASPGGSPTAPVVLVRVHALVGEAQRLGRVGRLVRQRRWRRASSRSGSRRPARDSAVGAGVHAAPPVDARAGRAARRTRRRPAGTRGRRSRPRRAGARPRRARSASPAGWPKTSL